ncbi:hypothetical protein PM082_013712 [Marasmius tenuissimus]|nr:hypothetical protein PM082_013712 [Marasmius tenuissimus]
MTVAFRNKAPKHRSSLLKNRHECRGLYVMRSQCDSILMNPSFLPTVNSGGCPSASGVITCRIGQYPWSAHKASGSQTRSQSYYFLVITDQRYYLCINCRWGLLRSQGPAHLPHLKLAKTLEKPQTFLVICKRGIQTPWRHPAKHQARIRPARVVFQY